MVGKRKPSNFLTNCNMKHDSIKFDKEKPTHSLESLDTLKIQMKNIKLQTTL